MHLAQHNRYIVPLSVCGQPCNWIRGTQLFGCEVCGVALLSGCNVGRVATVKLSVVLGWR